MSIIPQPVSYKSFSGQGFKLNNRITIHANPGLSFFIKSLLDRASRLFALSFIYSSDSTSKTTGEITFRLGAIPHVNSREAYRIMVRPSGVEITAPSHAGMFYALQSLLQLISLSIDNHSRQIPCSEIIDYPRFRWRGMHLDVSRHFFTTDEVKQYINILAAHKFNVFHWHLTDDQGWRIEIEKYPKLTEVGAWRTEKNGSLSGGFYTQDEIREIVKYAADRFITIMPEIEMPGHSLAALAAYPEYSCFGGPFSVWNEWGISKDVYCAGNDKTFRFLGEILDEVIGLFPGEYIHIGGDEYPTDRWANCPRCQARLISEQINGIEKLHGYFVNRIAAFLRSRDKRLIGWDEISQNDLTKDAVVMAWRGIDYGLEAARNGHDVIMCPTSHCYFDYYQTMDKENEPKAIGGYLPLETVYSFDPCPAELPSTVAEKIMGGQGNLWTEYMPDFKHIQYMALPRMCALSEALWSALSGKSLDSFFKRLKTHYCYLNATGVNYHPF